MMLRMCFVLMTLAATFANAQSARSTVLGRVTDPSGAPVAEAEVVLDNPQTGQKVTTKTTESGEYTVPNLEPGVYRLNISRQGFKTSQVTDIVVNISQSVRVDQTLEIGNVSTKVEVQATTPVIQTDASSVGNIVDGTQIKNMPLNGRQNIFGLLSLAPGVQNPAMNPYVGGNGGFGAVNLTIDGVGGNDAGNERNLTTVPSLDAVAEFKVVANGASAEFGRGGAQIVLVSKKGTNEFHGSLFAFNRNRFTAANSFFNNRGGIARPVFNRNEYGASLGGPIVKNKLFFFGSFEGFRLARAGQNVTQMPTQALREGNFAGLPQIRDPFANGAPFPDNRIPAARIGAVPRGLDQFFSTPNLPGGVAGLGNNFVVNIPVLEPVDRYSLRVDYNLSEKDQISGRFFRSANGPFNQSSVFFGIPGGPGTDKFGNWGGFGNATNNLMTNWTRIISPKLINEARFGVSVNNFFRTPQNSGFDPSTLIPGLIKPVDGLGGLPTVNILGFRGFSDAPGSGDRQATYELANTATYTAGKHTMKFGFEFLRVSSFNRQNTPPFRGRFDFDGRYAGHPFADYLLGAMSLSQRNTRNALNEPLNNRYFAFAQDDWQVTAKLTLNLGVRWEYQAPFTNAQGDLSNWYPDTNRVAVIQGLSNAEQRLLRLPVVDGSTIGLNTSNYVFRDLNNFAPRLGLAWRPFGNRFVVRSSYGIFYNVIAGYNGLLQQGITNPPFRVQENFEPAAGTVPSLTWANPFPGSGGIPTNPALVAIARNRVNPYMQQWNATIEYEVAKNTAFRVSYLGNKGTRLERNANINEPAMAPGVVQPRRPFQPWGPITYWESGRNSILHQLQVGLVRRYSSGLTFQFEYQFSRALNEFTFGDAPANPLDFRYDRGNQDGIRRHWAVLNYAYDLPFGQGKQFGSGVSKGVNYLIGGWQVSGIMSMGTGQPYSVGFTPTQLGWLPSRASLVSTYDAATPANRNIDRWFDPAAFQTPAPFTFGNTARNAFFGPGIWTWDSALFKNIQLRERLRVSLRFEAFNMLNRANFALPLTNISVPATVGRITGTVGEPRTLQFGFRVDF